MPIFADEITKRYDNEEYSKLLVVAALKTQKIVRR